MKILQNIAILLSICLSIGALSVAYQSLQIAQQSAETSRIAQISIANQSKKLQDSIEKQERPLIAVASEPSPIAQTPTDAQREFAANVPDDIPIHTILDDMPNDEQEMAQKFLHSQPESQAEDQQREWRLFLAGGSVEIHVRSVAWLVDKFNEDAPEIGVALRFSPMVDITNSFLAHTMDQKSDLVKCLSDVKKHLAILNILKIGSDLNVVKIDGLKTWTIETPEAPDKTPTIDTAAP